MRPRTLVPSQQPPPLSIPIMDNDILDERSREFLETADQYITEHGHQHVSEEDNKQLVSDQHNLPEEFRIDENGELSHHTSGYYDTDILSGNGSEALTEDDQRLANEIAAELVQQNKSLVNGDHHNDTHLMNSYLYSTDFDLNTNNKHSSQTSNHINNQQIISSESLIEVGASEEDYHAEIQNNLPHKKRFRKREAAPTPMRSIHPKCYKCKQCGEQFNSQSAFTAHRTIHTPKKGRLPFLCEICDKHFINQIKFFEHLKFHYEPQQSKVIVVTTDSGTSPHHVNYQNHSTQQESTNNDNQYIEETIEDQPDLHDLPPLQSYRLTEEESMDEDKHCLFSSDGSILAAQLQQPFPTCHFCGRHFRRLKALEMHMASVHPQPATVVTLVKQDCLEEFSDPEDLMEGIRHMVPGVADTESETEDKPTTIQDWAYNGESNTNHEDTMTKTKPDENTCLLNENEVNGENSRAEHTWEDDTNELEQIMKKNISKNLVCTQCKRKFNHRNSLLYHLRSHSGKRPHSCKLCPKSFFSSSALKVHNRLHTGDKPFECEWCGRNFRQWGDLKYHIASLHSESKQFQCEFCGKDFARKYSLIVHRRIHTGEKNYVCEFCKKTFRASSYLQNHRRIHTGEKPYKCETCGKAFRVRSDMRRHTVVHRKDSVHSIQISSYASQSNGSVATSDMNIHLAKLEVDKDKITSESEDVKYHENFSHNSNQLLTTDEVSAPLNLNLRAQDDGDNDEPTNFGQFNNRQEIIDGETNTLFVWLPNSEQLLQSE